MGYHRAGFDVVGVDIKPQSQFPFEFHLADALKFPLDGFDVIHASPPCQGYSVTRHATGKEYPMLLTPVRERLRRANKPYVIENVVGAPLESPILLCGTMFGLNTADVDGSLLFLRRHRLFESSQWLNMPSMCICADLTRRGMVCAGVYGGGSSRRSVTMRRGGYTPSCKIRRLLMNTLWITGKQLSQAIPPAYTEWIGRQLLEVL